MGTLKSSYDCSVDLDAVCPARPMARAHVAECYCFAQYERHHVRRRWLLLQGPDISSQLSRRGVNACFKLPAIVALLTIWWLDYTSTPLQAPGQSTSHRERRSISATGIQACLKITFLTTAAIKLHRERRQGAHANHAQQDKSCRTSKPASKRAGGLGGLGVTESDMLAT
jgi:hypothetical protein